MSQLETDEWNGHWVDETLKVRKHRYNTISVRSTWWWWALCVFSCAGHWTLLGQEPQRVREYLHWGSVVSAFTSSTSGPCLENTLFLWWDQEEISGCHSKQTKTQSYTWKIYFDWLIEFRAEEITGSDHSFVYVSHSSICHSTAMESKLCSSENKWRLSGINVFEEASWI